MFEEATAAAKDHALSVYPEEACGVIRGGEYTPYPNIAADPQASFELPPMAIVGAEAIVHSHCAPRHEPWPTADDMRAQQQSALPWGIVLTDGSGATDPLWFGDQLLNDELIGQEFQPGVHDCYWVLRANWWQLHNTKLPEFPRDTGWWATGQDLLSPVNFEQSGFVLIDPRDLQPEDVVIMRIRSKVANHCAIIKDGGLILHHLAHRVSRREPFGPWRNYVTHCLRHV